MSVLLACAAPADVRNCACDPSRPETMQARECSLCREAEKHPPEPPFFYLKDNNPRKPNRWLVLLRRHGKEGHPLDEMSHKERTMLWTAAIAKAKELWGEEWGVAYNGDEVRTQCHAHIHIGKLLKYVERPNPIVVSHPSQIPKPKGRGIWVHPVGKNKLHVHAGENICETVLLR